MLRRRSTSRAPLATDSTRSPSPPASITVARTPAPVIVSGAAPATFRSPLVLSSAPARGIDSTYRPDPSTIAFEPRLTRPQSLRVPGDSTASIASRSEHLPSCATSSSLVVVTLTVAATAATGLASGTHVTTPTVNPAIRQARTRSRVDRKAITRESFADHHAGVGERKRAGGIVRLSWRQRDAMGSGDAEAV